MIRKLFTFSLLSMGLLFAPATAFAQGDVCDEFPGEAGNSAFCQGQGDPDAGPDSSTDNAVLDILQTVVRVLTTIAAVIATIVIVIAGLMFVTSGGDPNRISRARSAIIYAIVAVVVSIFARVIILFVLNEISP